MIKVQSPPQIPLAHHSPHSSLPHSTLNKLEPNLIIKHLEGRSFSSSQVEGQRQQVYQYQNNSNKMYGKYSDSRVYQHFVHTYSRVPYLDSDIFNVETNALRESRRANQRVQTALEGLERTKEKSELLSNSLKASRHKKEEEAKEFLASLQKSQESCLEREKLSWSNYEREKEESQLNHIKDQKYLESLLKSNSTKAESRLTSVRRWN